jgi:hypothetical protein
MAEHTTLTVRRFVNSHRVYSLPRQYGHIKSIAWQEYMKVPFERKWLNRTGSIDESVTATIRSGGAHGRTARRGFEQALGALRPPVIVYDTGLVA